MYLRTKIATFALHGTKRLVFMTEAESVYCAVRTESSIKHIYVSSLRVNVTVPNLERKFWWSFRAGK